MWPQWAYMLTGVGCAWLFMIALAVLFWLKEEHEELFAGAMVLALVTIMGVVFGALAYENAFKKAHAPRPPAEATR